MSSLCTVPDNTSCLHTWICRSTTETEGEAYCRLRQIMGFVCNKMKITGKICLALPINPLYFLNYPLRPFFWRFGEGVGNLSGSDAVGRFVENTLSREIFQGNLAANAAPSLVEFPCQLSRNSDQEN